MKHRFRFLASFEKEGDSYLWTLEESECHHLTSVLKLSVPEEIEVFDGKGNFSIAHLEKVEGKKFVQARSVDIQYEDVSSQKRALALASLKKQTMEDLLPSLVELGLTEIHVFAQEKTPKHLFSEKVIERYEKIILSSCKQSKRNTLPVLKIWKDQNDLASFLTKNYSKIFLLTPEGEKLKSSDWKKEESVCAIVGSEAGLSPVEEDLFLSLGSLKRSLGSHILRAYTAAIAVASQLL